MSVALRIVQFLEISQKWRRTKSFSSCPIQPVRVGLRKFAAGAIAAMNAPLKAGGNFRMMENLPSEEQTK
jgi:hypothetical protein